MHIKQNEYKTLCIKWTLPNSVEGSNSFTLGAVLAQV